MFTSHRKKIPGAVPEENGGSSECERPSCCPVAWTGQFSAHSVRLIVCWCDLVIHCCRRRCCWSVSPSKRLWTRAIGSSLKLMISILNRLLGVCFPLVLVLDKRVSKSESKTTTPSYGPQPKVIMRLFNASSTARDQVCIAIDQRAN